jgi:hypothetical protein
MIDLYEKDLPKLKKHTKGYPSPEFLRSITKQGRHGGAPYKGYLSATEGSNWIIKSAKKKSGQPVWVLVWGGLDDVAQALHDAPEIQSKLRVYWIGGPNKKWGANSYSYIASNFPKLHLIEVNSSYYGFFSKSDLLDEINPSNYYEKHIRGAGELGKDFKNYYQGEIKMGDTPSLLYMMDGNPENPTKASWGGQFTPISQSPRVIFDRSTTLADTVAFCTLIEFHFKGPEISISKDSACFWMETSYKDQVQKWPGYYLGQGNYGLKYVPKQAETISYRFSSMIVGIALSPGQLVVTNTWPGKKNPMDFRLGDYWYTDKPELNLYEGKIQGGKTVHRWRNDVLNDWAKRWEWLK